MQIIDERQLNAYARMAFNRFCEWRKHNQKFFRPSITQKDLRNWTTLAEFAIENECSPEELVDWVVKGVPRAFPPLNFFKSKKRLNAALSQIKKIQTKETQNTLDCEYVELAVKNAVNILHYLKKSSYKAPYSATLMDETIPIPTFARVIIAATHSKVAVEKFLPELRQDLASDFELKRQFQNYLKKYNLKLDI